MTERKTRAGRMKRVHKPMMIRSAGRRFGAFAAAIQDQQLMAELHGFGDHTPEAAGHCQPNESQDRMNQEEDELAHSGNGIKASEHPIESIFVFRHGHVQQ